MRRRESELDRTEIQKFEIRQDGVSNTITTVVSKDCLTIAKVGRMASIEDYLYKDYGVFKLSPRECGRLMGVTDADIDKMMAVNSNTRLYQGFGNSIATTVLMAIFSQLNIKGIKAWNDRTDDERQALVDVTRDYEVVYGE